MERENKKIKIILLFAVPISLAAIFVMMSLHLLWQKNNENRIYPGVKVGNIDVSGLTVSEAEQKINNTISPLLKTGLSFSIEGKTINIPGESPVQSIEFTETIFSLDSHAAAEKAYTASRENEWQSWKKWLGIISEKTLPMDYQLNSKALQSLLKENAGKAEQPAENAYFVIVNGKLKIEQEKPGTTIDYQKIIDTTEKSLANLDFQLIKLEIIKQLPTLTSTDLKNIATAAEKFLDTEDVEILYNQQKFKIDRRELVSWIQPNLDNREEIDLNSEKIKEFLKNSIAEKINRSVKSPRFEMQNGRINSWQEGENGLTLDIEKSAENIKTSILEGKSEIELSVNVEEFSTEEGQINIKELIGTGHSNFVGSPKNRRQNIQTGANAIHGLLIKPGDEFSLIEHLVPVDKEHGYLQELVIKGNKTVPEYGGGLCQVGTTVFRAALSAGLPITYRQNHSYRVSYYEPAGTDAAVYDPSPDVRFINDTGNYVLIQARIIKNDLYFDFWGVKDGRVASTTKPVIFNIVKPQPTKTIISTDLKPGEKKCTEKAHNGADAYFDYSVTYPNGEVKARRFKSHYIPWQEVCLVGAATASSTEEIKNINASTTPLTGTTTP